MELSERLIKVRKENNLTQKEMADILFLSRTMIAQYERGHKIPSLNTINKISNEFDTLLFNEYKNIFKLIILNIKNLYPYIISLLLLIISSLSIINNIISVNSKYGYNIYNDELKVKNCSDICVVKLEYTIDNENDKYDRFSILINLKNGTDEIQMLNINSKFKLYSKIYYICFIDLNNEELDVGNIVKSIIIKHRPFIYPLKEYNEDLPYNKQTGECKKLLDYYIDLIEKN